MGNRSNVKCRIREICETICPTVSESSTQFALYCRHIFLPSVLSLPIVVITAMQNYSLKCPLIPPLGEYKGGWGNVIYVSSDKGASTCALLLQPELIPSQPELSDECISEQSIVQICGLTYLPIITKNLIQYKSH